MIVDRPGQPAPLAEQLEWLWKFPAPDGPFIGVGKNDMGVFTSQLQCDLLHIAARRLHYRFAGLQAAGKGDQIDIRTFREFGADADAGAEHGIDDP